MKSMCNKPLSILLILAMTASFSYGGGRSGGGGRGSMSSAIRSAPSPAFRSAPAPRMAPAPAMRLGAGAAGRGGVSGPSFRGGAPRFSAPFRPMSPSLRAPAGGNRSLGGVLRESSAPRLARPTPAPTPAAATPVFRSSPSLGSAARESSAPRTGQFSRRTLVVHRTYGRHPQFQRCPARFRGVARRQSRACGPNRR